MRIGRHLDENGHAIWALHRHGNTEGLIGDPLAGPVRPTGRAVAVKRTFAPLHIDPNGRFLGDIWCVGKNYAEHAAEFGGGVPEHPVLFMKPAASVIAHGDNIQLPACQLDGPETDYEAELAVVIGPSPDGRPAKDVPVDRALEHVLGYTCANDVSARRWQKERGGSQWVRGKSFDTFCPVGPVLVTARPAFDGDDDFIDDPQTLGITCTVSGEVLQRDTTANMVYSVATLIAFISRDTTLWPGTVILTGTPSGVGMARKPPRLLTHGDTVEVSIEHIAVLRNAVV